MSPRTPRAPLPDPIDDQAISTAPRLAIAPTYKDPVTGALYVHEALTLRTEPWADEAHRPPVRAAEKFGDVESFVAYVREHAGTPNAPPFLTWNATGLRAVLDYHGVGEAGRCQWVASCPFVLSPEWKAWTALAGGRPIPHKAAVEALEDLAVDIVEPPASDLAALLRSLRATVNATAQTDLRADGTATVSFSQDKRVSLPGLDLPPEFAIAIRALVGHVDDAGRPVLYRLPVRVRVSVDDQAHLAFRFAIPTAERVLEDVYADRVARAKALLGDAYPLLRAADAS